MCRLFGASGSEASVVYYPLSLFRELSREGNRDGWGIAFWDEHSSRFNLSKRPLAAIDDISFEEASDIEAKLVVAHIRGAGFGSPIIEKNCHPFEQSIGGRHYVFAHNGEIYRKDILYKKLQDHFPLSKYPTDSEVVFCYIMDRLQREGIDHLSSYLEVAYGIEKAIREIYKLTFGSLNFIMANQKYMYIFKWNAMSYTNLGIAEFENGRMGHDQSRGRDLLNTIIFCSQPLTDSGWKNILPGELVVCREGRVLYRKQVSKELQTPFTNQMRKVSVKTDLIESPQTLVGMEKVFSLPPRILNAIGKFPEVPPVELPVTDTLESVMSFEDWMKNHVPNYRCPCGEYLKHYVIGGLLYCSKCRRVWTVRCPICGS